MIMLKLDNTIKIMIPTQDNGGKNIDYMALIQGVTKLVNGSTVYNTKGLWSSDEKTYHDNNKLVEFNVDNSLVYKALSETIWTIVGPLLNDGGQMAVWLQVNGTTFILNHATRNELTEIAKTLHFKRQ